LTPVRNVCGSFCLFHRQQKRHYLSVRQNVCTDKKGKTKCLRTHRHFGLHLLSVKMALFVCATECLYRQKGQPKMSEDPQTKRVAPFVCTIGHDHRQFVSQTVCLTDSLSHILKIHQLKELKICHFFFLRLFYGLFSSNS